MMTAIEAFWSLAVSGVVILASLLGPFKFWRTARFVVGFACLVTAAALFVYISASGGF